MIEAGRASTSISPAVGEEPGDVLGLLDVDDPMAPAGRPEHREAGTAVGGQLRVHPRSAAAESAHELVDEALAFEAPHPRDHRQAWVEFDAEVVVVCFDDQSFVPHERCFDTPRGKLEPEVPCTWVVATTAVGSLRTRGNRLGNGRLAVA